MSVERRAYSDILELLLPCAVLPQLNSSHNIVFYGDFNDLFNFNDASTDDFLLVSILPVSLAQFSVFSNPTSRLIPYSYKRALVRSLEHLGSDRAVVIGSCCV